MLSLMLSVRCSTDLETGCRQPLKNNLPDDKTAMCGLTREG